MARGLSFKHSRSGILSGFLVFTIMASLSGCALQSPAQTSTKPIVCTPVSTDMVNIYRNPIVSWAGSIFEYAYPTLPPPIPPETPVPAQLNEQQILEARYAAFQYLTKETKRWSDTETIKLDDSSEAQLTITFISPRLIQAVYLNHVLKHRYFVSDFQTQFQPVLDSIASRDELLFLFTVTTTNNGNPNSNPHTLNIPINTMNLNNAENLQVAPNHDDHHMERPINTSREPIFGYIAYPLTTLSGNHCKILLDPKYNTNIVITIPNVLVDGVGNTPYTWTIPYTSLINGIIPEEPPIFMIPPDYHTDLLSNIILPPSPLANQNWTNSDDYWRDFARYVWNQITLGNY